MNDLLVWIIDEEWSDYEVEKELIKKLLPDAKIRHSGYDYKKDLEEFGYQADLILAQVYTKIDKELQFMVAVMTELILTQPEKRESW